MKKICFFTNGVLPVPPVKGGAVENLVKLLLDENENCHEANFYVTSIYDPDALEESKKVKYCDFKFIRIPAVIKIFDKILYYFARIVLRKKALSFRMIFARLWYINKSKNYFLKNDFDCIIAENHVSLFLVMKNKHMLDKYGQKFFYHAHNEAYRSTFFCKKQIENCKCILTVSDFVTKSWKQRFPNCNANFKCVLNGIDVKLFSQKLTDIEKINLRKQLGISEKDFVIIFVGRIVEGKGILQLSKVFSKLPISNKKLLIVGSAFFESNAKSPIQKQLEEILSPCKDKVIFTGYINYNDIWKYYGLSTISAFIPLWNESCALNNIEAQLSSLPVITTCSGGIPEYLNPESQILLNIDENLEKKLYEKIIWLYNNPSYCKEFGKKNSDFAQKFSVENYYRCFMNEVGAAI